MLKAEIIRIYHCFTSTPFTITHQVCSVNLNHLSQAVADLEVWGPSWALCSRCINHSLHFFLYRVKRQWNNFFPSPLLDSFNVKNPNVLTTF